MYRTVNDKKSITKKTKIILPVHYTGMPSNLEEISELCEQHNIILMEDQLMQLDLDIKHRKKAHMEQLYVLDFTLQKI